MLIIPPAPFRRRHRRAKDTTAVPAGLLIVSAAVLDPANPGFVTVSFSGAIAWDSSQIPRNFQAQTTSGTHGADDVVTVGVDSITLFFFPDVVVGGAWLLNSQMQGISPAVAFPQEGIVSG